MSTDPPHNHRFFAILSGALTLAALATIVGLWGYISWHSSLVVDGERIFWLDDDQMISMRYGRHLARGEGLVWNPGERVEGYSNFLWTLLMAGAHLTPLPASQLPLLMKTVNLGLLIGTLFLAGRLFRQITPQPGWLLPALILALALTPDLIYWAANGFETTLLTFLFLGTILLIYDRPEPHWGAFVLLALIPLVRSDAFYLWGAAALLALGFGGFTRRTVFGLLLSLLLPLAHLIWRFFYYGDWLPNTYYLKVNGLPNPWQRGAIDILRFVRHYHLPLTLAFGGLFLIRDKRWAALLAPLLIGIIYILIVGDDIFPFSRFLAFAIPPLIIVALSAIDRLTRQKSPAQLVLVGALLVSLIISTQLYDLPALVSTNGVPQAGLVAGLAINRHSSEEATVGVMAAGMVPYFSDRYCYDLLGKSDPYIARLPAQPGLSAGHNKFDVPYSLAQEPDIVVTFLPATVVAEWGEYDGGLLANLSNHYTIALVNDDLFRANYAANPVPIDYLQRKNSVYIRQDSPELDGINLWGEFTIGE